MDENELQPWQITYQELRKQYEDVAFVHEVTMTLKQIPHRTDGLGGISGTHYEFTLWRTMTEPYVGQWSQGPGRKEPPTIVDVLNALLQDTFEYFWVREIEDELERYEKWAREMDGNLCDSSVKMYRQTKKTFEALIRLFGEEGYKELSELERL